MITQLQFYFAGEIKLSIKQAACHIYNDREFFTYTSLTIG